MGEGRLRERGEFVSRIQAGAGILFVGQEFFSREKLLIVLPAVSVSERSPRKTAYVISACSRSPLLVLNVKAELKQCFLMDGARVTSRYHPSFFPLFSVSILFHLFSNF